MKNLAVVLTPLLLASVPACDTASPAPDELRAEPDLADDAEHPDATPHGHHRGGPGPFQAAVDRLCGAVGCTDAQRGQLEALAPARPHRGDHDDDERHAERKASHKQLADAFRGETLDTSVLAELEAARAARHADKRARWASAALQAHGILTPEQRETAATTLEALAPMLDGKRGGSRRVQRSTDRLCEVAKCEGEQAAQIKAALTDATPQPDGDAIAVTKAKALAAVRAETIDAATVEAIINDIEALKHAHKPRMEAMLSEVHAILTPEQRAIVAETIERHGPRALLGHKGRRGHGKGHRGKPRAG